MRGVTPAVRGLARALSPHADRAYAVLRIVSGLLFSFHGMQKVLHVFAKTPPEVGSQIWIGGLIELVCGVLLAFGLLTRAAAILSSGTMAVAYVQFHWKLQLGREFFPTINRGELAVVYAFLFLYVACRGPGIWSIDSKVSGRR